MTPTGTAAAQSSSARTARSQGCWQELARASASQRTPPVEAKRAKALCWEPSRFMVKPLSESERFALTRAAEAVPALTVVELAGASPWAWHSAAEGGLN